jgi:hypothetical protein
MGGQVKVSCMEEKGVVRAEVRELSLVSVVGTEGVEE